MDRETSRDLVVMGAAVLGVAIGHALRSRAEPQERESGGRAEPPAMIVPSVIGSMAVSKRVATTLPIEADEVVVHAAVAAAVGAALAYFSHGLGRLGPRVAMLLR